jgi:CRP-like cAMP-binding protein
MIGQQTIPVGLGEGRIRMKKSARRRFKFSFSHNHLFGTLKPGKLEAFQRNQITELYPAGVIVLSAGATPKGIYLVRSGKIKLSTVGRGRGGPASRIASRGEILGLSAMVSGKPCEVTSETLSPAQLSFIPRNTIIRLMDEDSEFAFRVLQYLCNDLGDAFDSVRSHLRRLHRNHKSA